MPFINLIEEQRLAKRREGTKARTALFVLSGVTGLAVVGCGFLFLAGEALEGEASRLTTEAAKVKPMLDEIDTVNNDIAVMGPKLTTLENAQELTLKWDKILNHLTVQTPKEIYLTNLRCNASDPTKPIEIDFSGMGQRLQTIGEFILRIQSCDQLENVNLKNTQEKMVSNATGIEFDILANVAGTATEDKTKNEEKETKK
jgi:Tfp pilus assembly protein PilN